MLIGFLIQAGDILEGTLVILIGVTSQVGDVYREDLVMLIGFLQI